jgi:O-antigen/teichoic acid export membrane protein
MSFYNYGPWSLVGMHIVNALFSNVFICISARWWPSRSFSYISLRRLFAYGEFMLISDILNNVCFHIQSTLVGKYFSPYTAGQYSQAKKMEEVACITLPSALNQVLFPLYSRLQHDITEMTRMLQQNTKMIVMKFLEQILLVKI